MGQLLGRLRALGLRLALEDGRLKVNAPKGALTDAIKATIAARREDIIRALRAPGAAQDTMNGNCSAHLGSRPCR